VPDEAGRRNTLEPLCRASGEPGKDALGAGGAARQIDGAESVMVLPLVAPVVPSSSSSVVACRR